VEYANNKLWGSLTCTLIVDTASHKANAALVEKALDDLKFGAIGLNQVGGFAVIFSQLPWGAYPRHDTYDVQSGMGKLGNAYCVNDVVKGIIRAPFTWMAQTKIHRDGTRAVTEASRASEFFVHNNMWRLTKLIVHAITGK